MLALVFDGELKLLEVPVPEPKPVISNRDVISDIIFWLFEPEKRRLIFFKAFMALSKEG